MKKVKTKIIIASLLGFVFISFLAFLNYSRFPQEEKFYILNVLQCVLFDKNTILVTGKNIDINKITVELIDESQGVVFKNGKKVKRIKNEYGGDNFIIFYDSLLIAQAGIFKTNWYHTHTYCFDVVKKDSTFDFNFRVKGANSESLYYRVFAADKQNKTLTTINYDKNGKTGYISIEYYDDNENIIVDELWKNDTLVNLNLYKNGELNKSYSTNKSLKTTTYKIIKEPHHDSLIYLHQTIEDGKIETEKIEIKNYVG